MDLTSAALQRCMPQAPRAACEVYAPAIRNAAVEFGQDEPNRLAAMLASAANESGQLTRFEEASYYGTPSDRIELIFGGRAPSAGTLEEWKARGRRGFDEAFFDWVYGGMLGNAGAGYKFRGLGLGQITGHDNCAAISPVIGVDLVADPEQMLDPVIGSRAFAAYLKINHITDPAVDGTEAGFLASVRRSNPGLAESEFHTHHLVRWHEVRRGLGIEGGSFDVAAVQRALNGDGNYHRQLVVDGIMGPATADRLRKYQIASGLPVTGSPDAATLAALGLKAAA
jgi:putative chitinase